MIVWNGIDRYPRDTGPIVATIGNYDGVHVGHQAILRSATSAARAREARSLLITFEPHPLQVVAPERAPRRLQTRGQKLECLEALGLDSVLILRFDETLSAMTGEAFFAELLRGRVEFAEIHVGENFRFGHNRAGDVDLLRALGAGRGFRVIGIPRVQLQGDVVSSSAIRRAVESGDVDRARRMLGRPFEMTGEIVQGEGRGRSLDFPTANLESENELPPQRGVYVTEAVVLSARYGAVTNVGVRPTFGGQRLTIESHLLDVEEEMVGERMDLRFLARLRDEKRFANATELADQIARDRAAAIAFFRNSEMFTR